MSEAVTKEPMPLFEFDEEIEFILGRPNFWCASLIVPALRANGQQIETKAESEQAAAIYWMLQKYRQYGKDWMKKASIDLTDILDAGKVPDQNASKSEGK